MRTGPLALILTCALSAGGCAGSHTWFTPSPDAPDERVAASPAPAAEAPTHVHAEPSDPEDVEFDGARWSDDPLEVADRERRTMLIGLFGETTVDEGLGVSDGTSNIAQVTAIRDGDCFDPCVDTSGDWLAFASTMHGHTSDIYVRSTQGRVVTQLTSDPADDRMPVFSPDGRRVAFASNRAGNWDIYITTVNGGRPSQITFDAEAELHPTWSPDGSRIAYCRLGPRGQWEIWVVDPQTPNVRHFLDYGRLPKWCPDVARNKILYQRARRRGSRLFGIWTIDYHNDEASMPTEIIAAGNAALINPSWSPDGNRIVFATVVDPDPGSEQLPTQADLWIINVDGTGRTMLTGGEFANFQPAWSADGTVYFVSDRSGVFNVWSVSSERSIRTTAPGGAVANVEE